MNRVRISFQVLFLSDILGASGKLLDTKYLRRREAEYKWSAFNFPREKPPNKNINLWRLVLRWLVPMWGRTEALGQVIREDHKIWPWRIDTVNDRLLHYTSTGVDVYKQAQNQHQQNRWTQTDADQAIERCDDICTTARTGN